MVETAFLANYTVSVSLAHIKTTFFLQSGWKNWKRVSGILCDRRISLRVEGKVYKTVVRPANDVRGRDLGSEESTREEVGCGGHEDVKMDEWSHQAGQN